MESLHVEWCDELRRRRQEFGGSRERAGIERQIVWFHPPSGISIVRIDADDPVAAIRRLRSSPDEFDRWDAAQELAVHGRSIADALVPAPEALTEYRNGIPDELDMFISIAVPLLPGKKELLRAAVGHSTSSGDGHERVRRWNLRRLTVWLHETHAGDVVVYESVGDIPAMVRSLASDDDPLIAGQRQWFIELFGIDVGTSTWPIPLPSVSWSAAAAPPP
jgi:hypothetical protein